TALFADRAEAAEWLGNRDAVRVSEELDTLVDTIRGTPPELRRVQEHLQTNLANPTLDGVAGELRLSRRSPQRLLQEAGTSFRRQVEHARVRAAERLLCDSDLKLEVVARQLGYSTLPHFSNAFSRATGETPSDFRRRRRSE